MKYYSDEIVKQIIKDTMEYTMSISQGVPMSAEHYPSIEIPDKHGDLVEISKVKEAQRIHGQASPWDSYVPIILEATE